MVANELASMKMRVKALFNTKLKMIVTWKNNVKLRRNT